MGFTAEGFKIETVTSCPVTRGSQGVLTMTPAMIGQVATAVRDTIEWMVLLHGERSADGYEVTVDRFTVPLQHRSGAEVELADKNFILPADCIGVMHSHHKMGAFFSGTDTGDLNPRFPTSIVVAIANNNLGFKYQATGKVMLPCGALGYVDFELAVDGVKRFAAKPVKGKHDRKDLAAKDTVSNNTSGLAGCTHRQYATHPTDEYLAVEQSACGLTRGDEVEKPFVFGLDETNSILAVVAAQTVAQVDRRLPAHYSGSGEGYWTWEKGRQVFKPYTNNGDGNGSKQTKKQRKQAKLSARRNGLVKLERPDEHTDNGGYRIEGSCDGCHLRKPLKKTWNPFVEEDDWLCVWCSDELAEEIEKAAESGGFSDDSLIVTDEIPMGNGFGWGV